MNHPIYQVRTVEIVEPYTLRVGFTDGTEQTIYLKSVLAGELYGPLLDPELFNRGGRGSRSENAGVAERR